MFDFFVSHSSTDKSSIVNELVTVLQNMGYTVWYDKNEILAGDGILSSVKYGLSNSYCLILVITDNFAKSKWTFYETGTFDAQNNRIIPLIYDVSETEKNTITGMLGNRKYLDMNKITKEEAASELAKALNRAKNENADLQTIEKLKLIQKKLASFETVNSEIISLKLKEYLDLLDTHKDFLVLAAKQIVKITAEDLLKHYGCVIGGDLDNNTLLKLINDHNIGSVNFREYYEFILSLDMEEGNAWFRMNEHQDVKFRDYTPDDYIPEALKCYQKGLRVLTTFLLNDTYDNPAEQYLWDGMQTFHWSFHMCIAACYKKLGNIEECEKSIAEAYQLVSVVWNDFEDKKDYYMEPFYKQLRDYDIAEYIK